MRRRGGGRQGRGVRARGRPRCLPLPQLPATCPPADGGGAPRPPGPRAERGGALRTGRDFFGGEGVRGGKKGKEGGGSSRELFAWGKILPGGGGRVELVGVTLASTGPARTWSPARLSMGWVLGGAGSPAVFQVTFQTFLLPRPPSRCPRLWLGFDGATVPKVAGDGVRRRSRRRKSLGAGSGRCRRSLEGEGRRGMLSLG